MNENVKLRIDNLSVYYGNFRALREVTVDIPARQITSIIGPSGCGKSTFLRSFNAERTDPGTHVSGEVCSTATTSTFRRVDCAAVGLVSSGRIRPQDDFRQSGYGARSHGLRTTQTRRDRGALPRRRRCGSKSR